jgi:hypothetical protein
MMSMKRLVCVLLVIFLAVAGLGLGLAQQVPPEEPVQEEVVVEEQGKIIPGPKDIKEKTAIYVFLGWMWVSIIVLVYILKLKINEVDRLLHIKYFDEKDKS